MSSDYIPRLRGELLRAAATPQPRLRPARVLRPLAVAASVAVLVAAATIVLPLGSDEHAVQPATGTVFTYRVDPPGAAARTARVLDARLAGAGIEGAHVSVADATLTITAPAADRADIAALVQPGRIAFYDWEASVLGPRGRPAPADTSVTGDPDAGSAAAVTKGQADARAADVRGARVVAAQGGAGWFAVGGLPALTDQDIETARATDGGPGDEWLVRLELDAGGQAAFTDLTRDIARRGAENAPPGAGVEAFQHLAIVVDDRIVSVPYVDFKRVPNGLDGAAHVVIAGGLTQQKARDLASVLDTGPLPATLR